jgi:hypothetical protein
MLAKNALAITTNRRPSIEAGMLVILWFKDTGIMPPDRH